nr:transglutaminase-like cysteine peptidase [Allorhizobium undicola]
MLAAAEPAFALSGSMKVTGRASQPIGHYEFCRQSPSECKPLDGDSGPLPLSPALWQDIVNVNVSVNSAIKPETDKEIYGVEEKWAYPTTAGDCEDYALLKRRMLMQKGISASDLLMTVVLQPNGEGHAVLTVRTDRGDFVLDNMRDQVKLWSETEYTYLKRQAADDPGHWMKILDGRAPASATVTTVAGN